MKSDPAAYEMVQAQRARIRALRETVERQIDELKARVMGPDALAALVERVRAGGRPAHLRALLTVLAELPHHARTARKLASAFESLVRLEPRRDGVDAPPLAAANRTAVAQAGWPRRPRQAGQGHPARFPARR